MKEGRKEGRNIHNENMPSQIFRYFLISTQNIDCGFEPPQ